MGYPPIEQPYYYQPQFDPNDPLVTPPDGGVAGWVSRISATFKRSWRSVISIIFVAQILPALVLLLVIGGIVAAVVIADPDVVTRTLGFDPSDPSAEPDPARLISIGIVAVAAGLVIGVVAAWFQSVTWAAATWAIVREAATGQRVRLGEALGYGVRRSLALWGWTLLGGLLYLLGLLACFLPGLYVLLGLMMLTPIVLFERQGIGASFRALHRNLLVIGVRAVIIWGVAQAVGSMVGVVVQIPFAALMSAPDPVYLVVYSLAIVPVELVVLLPLSAFQIIGTLLIYAEQRAQAAPLSTAQLAAELG
ncbi:hypothetical protein ACIA8K_12060 [Catenuloplanes sp. NPDC051500]|uniref:hypothetical protein n=1 Tax=Catenuloplanes sp. NPDC051500 TaxID=3363959 RepID=UPI0037B98CCE